MNRFNEFFCELLQKVKALEPGIAGDFDMLKIFASESLQLAKRGNINVRHFELTNKKISGKTYKNGEESLRIFKETKKELLVDLQSVSGPC